jgi:hypothetical protein
LLLGGLIYAGLFAYAPPAAAVGKVSCVVAHESAQQMRHRNEMDQSREQLIICADPTCPALVREDCRTWLSEIDSPSAPDVQSSAPQPAPPPSVPPPEAERAAPAGAAVRAPAPPLPSPPAASLSPPLRDEDPGPFLVAVQWHPEWKVTENPFYLGLFQAFAAACRERAHHRA